MLEVAPLGQHIRRHAQGLQVGEALFQGVRVVRHHLDQRVHIVKVFSFPVHALLQISPGVDGVAQLLEVLAGVPHIPHPGAVHHGGLGDGAHRLFPGLAAKLKAEAHPLPGLDEGRQPALAHHRGIAVARDVEVGVVHPVQQQVVRGMAVDGGGGDEVRDGGGSSLQHIDAAGEGLFPKPFLSLFPRHNGSGGLDFLQSGFVKDAVDRPQHVKGPFRQPDMLGGVLVQQAVEQFQNEVVLVFRLQHRHPAAVQIPPGHLRLLIEQGGDGAGGVVRSLHAGVIGEGQEEPMGDGLPLHQLGDVGHALLDHLPAPLVPLPLQRPAQHLHVAVQIEFLGEDVDLEVGRGDLQIGGQVGDGRALFHLRHGVEVDGQQLHDLDEPLVPGEHHAFDDVLDGEPRLDAPSVGHAPVTDAGHAAAEDKLFQIHVHLPLLDKS